MTIFKLPDLGEGLPDAEISAWHVKIGQSVVLDESLVSMETAKAVVEVPSPFTGIIKKLYGNPGDIIKTGAPLVEFESDAAAQTVGSSGNPTSTFAPPTLHSEENDAATVAGKLPVGNTILQESAMGVSVKLRTAQGATIKATPAVRALAQRLRVDLAQVIPSGPGNTITSQDVEKAEALQTKQNNTEMKLQQYEPLTGVRRNMAQAMMRAHAEIVPVTVMEDAKLFQWKEKQDITVRLIQAIGHAYKKEPALNAWFDTPTLSKRIIKELHLGMAVDTSDGLFVSVIHQAENLTEGELRQKIDTLKAQVSNRSIKPEDLRGATFTLSNFGKFAGRYANPIVVPPTVAILGVGRLREEAVVVQGKIEVCLVLPLALTVDHRAVTGGEATRFLAALIESLEKG